MTRSDSERQEAPPSQLIDARIKELWSHAGIICPGETYKNVVEMSFAKGASLEDPSALFNSGLEGNTRRAIDLREGEESDEEALRALIRAAVALNTTRSRGARAAAT